MILAVHNPKGGVGKTTTAVNLAAVLARGDRQVLLVDLGTFAGASISLGVRPDDLHPSITDVLLNRIRATEAVRPVAGSPNLHLISGALTIEAVEADLHQQRQPERRLGEAMRALNSLFDVIVLDAPSGFSLISSSTLATAERVIVPVPAEYLAIEALAHFLRWYRDLSARRKGQATLLGILLTMVDYRAQATREIIEMLRVHNRDGAFATEIPRDPRVSEAPSHGLPLVAYAPRSRAALAYEQLGTELQQRLGRRSR